MLFNFIHPNRCYPNRILSSSSGYYEPLFNDHQYNSSTGIFHLTNILSLRTTARWFIAIFFRLIIIISGIISGFALYHRTTNLWTLKNLGDTFMSKNIGRRPIVLGAFHRLKEEQNLDGDFAVIHFLGDGRQIHSLFCISEYNGNTIITRAQIERIHKGKRAANDICSWSGHLAELTTNGNLLSLDLTNQNERSINVQLEKPLLFNNGKKYPLVVCIAPMYTYTDWQIMLMGIETWISLGAQKIIFPIQSASADTLLILKEYERIGIVHIRKWPKWPLLSDINPNGLVLSRGIEESHVNCLHFVKPFAEMVVFTDIDDMLMPLDPMKIYPGVNIELLRSIFREHPNAGSLLFEHRDVQFIPPETKQGQLFQSLSDFNFSFLHQTRWKTKCKIWRMKTRVVVNASRVDSVNMHETGIHRFGYAQVRVPCRRAHFYHLRHSFKNIALNEWPINLNLLQSKLEEQWKQRLNFNFTKESTETKLIPSSVESFADFDNCMIAINEEHWSLSVSRCLTPHVCYSRMVRNMSCIAAIADYGFSYSGNGDYVSALKNEAEFGPSELNCEAPLPKFSFGNHYYIP